MKTGQTPRNPMQALVLAIFDVRPPVLKDVRINMPTPGLETVGLEVVLTPELIEAWSERCKEIV